MAVFEKSGIVRCDWIAIGSENRSTVSSPVPVRQPALDLGDQLRVQCGGVPVDLFDSAAP